ncbi:hypothetical protein P389DRAFT_473 [Cystobasidium minutum MCA 4210]|uniref:uncharacterized protein n=1 Tax=Cystobasidium minutum MCA 4210 TaxID=1397322 RepID=UPI0034CEE5D5|eukprot:jgi/Rhomi1/473/CE472_286
MPGYGGGAGIAVKQFHCLLALIKPMLSQAQLFKVSRMCTVIKLSSSSMVCAEWWHCSSRQGRSVMEMVSVKQDYHRESPFGRLGREDLRGQEGKRRRPVSLSFHHTDLMLLLLVSRHFLTSLLLSRLRRSSQLRLQCWDESVVQTGQKKGQQYLQAGGG